MAGTNAARASVSDMDISLEARPSRDGFQTAGSNVAFLSGQKFGDASLNAIAARQAGRVNAASIKESEVDKLLDERKALVTKRFDCGLSKAEERRLALIRWNLDRIQDAKHGATLDALEAAVSLYESIGAEISQLLQNLEAYAPKNRRR